MFNWGFLLSYFGGNKESIYKIKSPLTLFSCMFYNQWNALQINTSHCSYSK